MSELAHDPRSNPDQGKPVLAYVVNTLNAGGTERLVVDMSLAFAAQFHVHVFCLDEPGVWASELRRRGIPVRCLWRQPGLDLRIPSLLARGLRAVGADIVHAHQCTAWFYAALSRLVYRKPRLVFEEHGRFYPEVDKLPRRLFNRLLIRRLTHRFVAVSQDIRARLERYEGLAGAPIEVIYNGFAAEQPLTLAARAQLRRELGFAADDFVVGTVGRFDPIKNLPMLVASLAAAGRQMPSLRGLLVGDGPQLESIRQLIASSGLQERVRLTGFRDDARRLVQCLDLFVLASFSEGTSMALLEAIAAGIPVAVTGVGGNPEVVLAGETGWVVPSGVADALTAAILEAARDPRLRSERALAGRARFEERFAFGKMISSYAALYRSLAAPDIGAGAEAWMRQ